MEKTQHVSEKKGMARLMEIAATKKYYIMASIVCSAIASVVSFIPYLAIYRVVETILISLPNLQNVDGDALIRYGWWAFGGVVGNILLYFSALAFSHLAAFNTLYILKVNFASHLARVPLGFHVMIGSGKLRKIMDENIEKIEGFIAHQLPDIVGAFVAPITMIVILLVIDWRLGLSAIVGIGVSFLLYIAAYGKESAKKMMERYQKSLDDMNNASVEYVRGISVVKAFKQTVYSFRSLHDTIKNYTSMVIPYTLTWENIFSLFTVLVNNIYLFVVPVAIFIGMSTKDYVSFASTFIFYLLFVPAIAGILMKIMYVNSDSIRILSGVEAMDQLLASPELSQPVNPKEVSNYDVAFNDVRFSYQNNAEIEALSGISFLAKQGEVTAIVGPSGGGKSTIAHLIPRFFDVTEGSITLGDVDIREMTTNYLMDQVSFVFQDVFLFKQSVKENIKMAKPGASDEEIIKAAKAAQCHDFITKLPNGYDTVIGTKGVHLSGGEKQRIAIARAIVKDAPIIVLDEATAFSDPENEHLIQKAFEELMKHKTVVMIAHRLATIQSANRIIVVNEGKKVEEGSHSELLEKKGKYYDMWQVYTQISSWKMTSKKGVK